MQNELIAVFTADGFYLDAAQTDAGQVFYSEQMLERFKVAPWDALYDLGFMPEYAHYSPGLAYLADIAKTFVHAASTDSDIEITRRVREATGEELLGLLHSLPFVLGFEYVSAVWLKGVWQQLQHIADAQIAAADASVVDYLRGKDESINVVGRVFFHLVEHSNERFPFAFLATYSTGSSAKVNHVPLRQALKEFKSQTDTLLGLLSPVSCAVEQSELISGLVESGELFSPIGLVPAEAYTFLREIPLYEDSGIVCRIPNWWRSKHQAHLALEVGTREPAALGLEALLDFDATAFLGDIQFSREELAELLGMSEGLAMVKGKWVEVDHARLAQVLDTLDKLENLETLTLADALRMQMGLAVGGIDEGLLDIEVTNGEWMQRVRAVLTDPTSTKDVRAGRGFKAQLRGYQQQGLNWLTSMQALGFGALLADDMGLGKTVQVLAFLEHRRNTTQEKVAPSLLAVPASLLHNWQRELDRFAPKLRYRVVHTGNKQFNPDEADLFITTYGIASRLETLRSLLWDTLIVDEAQAIKNPATKQTRAIKGIKSQFRIALTGTPIENRLSDLWSIFDFLNQGLLGTRQEFGDFEAALRSDHAGYSRLRSMVSPFILRRVKTDKSIIDDLPEKLEFKQFTSLTKQQVALYRSLLDSLEQALTVATGIARRGLVLSSIMKFKQVCNHPDHYLGQQEYRPEQSGKFQYLAELCTTIREKHEKLVVFTQFKEIVEPLARYLKELFGHEGLTLHGGTPVKRRGKLVESFNNDEYVPFMVLSLKAGGVGLNLTAANHVVHFDRWWNPAIENQATDRVFRIGQQRDVVVHKFVTAGTIEEKIDTLLASKQGLADEIIASSGEKWITEMDNDELLQLFTLGGV
jgi:non-specific serine/threonine protein kinase